MPRTHQQSQTRLYFVWKHINQRTTNPNDKDFKHYGGRGIARCDEWASFVVFSDWASKNGYAANLELDRIDVNGNYTPDNCRFVTHKENLRNQRSNRRVTAFGETKILVEWAEDPRCVVGYDRLRARLNGGWDAERSITAKVPSAPAL